MAKIQQTAGAAIGLIFTVLLLGGCGAAKVPEIIEYNSLVIGKDGAVTAYTVGVFDREYYDLQGLRAMAQEETAAYNTVHQRGTETPVLVERVASLEGDGGRVVVSYRYDSADTYADYNGRLLFYGTAAQARMAGYDPEALNQVLYDPKGGRSIVSADLNGDSLSGKHLVLVQEPVRVYCPYKVAYASEGAKVLGDGCVDTTDADETAFPIIILMKK